VALTVEGGVGSSARKTGALRRAWRFGAATALVAGVWCLGSTASATALPPLPVPPVTIPPVATPPVAIPQVGPPPQVDVHVGPHGAHGGVQSPDGSGVDADASHDGVQITAPGDGTQLPMPTIPSAPNQPVAVPPFPFPVTPAPGTPAGVAPPAAAPGSATGSAATNSDTAGASASRRSSRVPSVSAEGEQVAGSIRPGRRSSWSRIGVEAATIGPWLALCLLALVMRAAGVSALRERLSRRRSRVVS